MLCPLTVIVVKTHGSLLIVIGLMKRAAQPKMTLCLFCATRIANGCVLQRPETTKASSEGSLD